MVPMSKVKSLCTTTETEVVRASRKPEINKLSAGDARRYTSRARKLFDKWQGQSRKQSRASGRQTGSSEGNDRTEMKAQIFKEALEQFEARAEKMGAAAGKSAAKKPAAKKPAAKKPAAKQASEKKSSAKKSATKATKPAASIKPAAHTETAAPKSKSAKSGALRSFTLPSSRSPLPGISTTKPSKRKQLAAKTASKQSRVDESGLRSRIHGHIAARGKRNQAKRDAR